LLVFLERLAANAGSHAALLGINQLPAIVAVPRRPRTRLELAAAAGDVLRIHCRHDAGEVRIARRLLPRND
jgi:hypothetical protein